MLNYIKLWNNGETNEAIKEIEKIKEKGSPDERLRAMLYHPWIKLHDTTVRPAMPTLKILENELEGSNNEKYLVYLNVMKMFFISNTEPKSSEFIEAKEYVDQSNLSKWVDLDSKVFSGLYYHSLGHYFHDSEEERLFAHQCYEKAISIFEEVSFFMPMGASVHGYALACQRLAMLDECINELERTLQLIKGSKTTYLKKILTWHLGCTYILKGEFSLAQVYTESALELGKELDGYRKDIFILESLAQIALARNQFNKAKELLIMELQNMESFQQRFYISLVIFRLINLNPNSKDLETQKYLSRLEELSSVSARTEYLFKLAQALILKEENRNISTSKAQNLLLELLDLPYPSYEFLMITIYNLSDILFQEFLQYQNESILSEIQAILSSAINEDNSAFYLSSKTLLIGYKLALFQNDLDLAKQKLQRLYEISESKGFSHLTIEIYDEIEHFDQSINKYRGNHTKAISGEFGKILSQMSSNVNFGETLSIDLEIPIRIQLKLKENQMKIVDMQIEQTEIVSLDQNPESEVTFSSKFGSINFSKTKNYKLITVETKNEIYSYVFLGSTFSAQMKLKSIIEAIQGFLINNKLSLSSPNVSETVSHIVGQYFNENIEDIDVLFPEQFMHYYKILLNPVRLSIIKLLDKYTRYLLSDIREMLNISWGKFSTHITKLEKEAYIKKETEFIDTKPRQVLYIEPKGRAAYQEMKSILMLNLT